MQTSNVGKGLKNHIVIKKKPCRFILRLLWTCLRQEVFLGGYVIGCVPLWRNSSGAQAGTPAGQGGAQGPPPKNHAGGPRVAETLRDELGPRGPGDATGVGRG